MPAPLSLRVLTLNTWGLPRPLSNVSVRQRYRHIAHYLRTEAFDIAALQEVWPIAPALAVPHPLWRPDAGRSGLALLTPHPVEWVRVRGYGARRLLPFVEKGLLHARVLLEGVALHVINTHLQAYRKGSDASARARQIDVLLDEVASVSGPLLVMGDLNLYQDVARDHDSARRLAAAGLRDSSDGRPLQPTFHDPGETERFDRVLVRDAGGHRFTVHEHHVEHYRFGKRRLPFLSDHLPVEVTLELSR